MKKAVISLAIILAACSANAETKNIKVTIEGRIDFQAGRVHEKRKGEIANANGYSIASSNLINYDVLTPKMNNWGFVNDTNFDIKADVKHSPDLTYGAFLRLHGDTSIATNREMYLGDKAMIYIQHEKVGRLEMGNIPGAGGLFEMDTVNLGRGTYGIEGFWSQWVVDKSIRTSNIFNASQINFQGASIEQLIAANGMDGEKATRSFEFIVSPNLLSNYSGQYYSDAPKINFFTKPMTGLTLGVAFIPDLDSAGTVSNRAPKNDGPQDDRKGNPATYRNIISGGFMYETKLNNDLGIKTGIAGEYGIAKLPYVTKLRAYEMGLTLSYKDIKVGGTYGSWFDSLSLKTKTEGARHGSRYYTVTASHQIEKFGYSLGLMDSKKAGGIEILGLQVLNGPLAEAIAYTDLTPQSFGDPKMNRFRNISFDIDYKLAPGFLPYLGVSWFNFKESYGASDRGYVALIGTRVTF